MYPRLRKLLELLASSNDFILKNRFDLPPDSFKLEDLACALRADGVDRPDMFSDSYSNEYELLVDGEFNDITKLVNSKGLHRLDEFLNEAFDGKYRYRFFL